MPSNQNQKKRDGRSMLTARCRQKRDAPAPDPELGARELRKGCIQTEPLADAVASHGLFVQEGSSPW